MRRLGSVVVDRPCIRCADQTCSHTDYPLCGVCFKYLTVCYCGPRHLTQGIRDGLDALARHRAFHGLTDPAPTSEVWAWLLPYLGARGRYARAHHGSLPTARPVVDDNDRRRLDRTQATPGA